MSVACAHLSRHCVGGSVSKTLKSLFISTADRVQARTRCCDGCKKETRASNASNNCSFASVVRTPVYACRIVQHFNDKLNLCDKTSCSSVSVATFNIGISSSSRTLIAGKDNEFGKAKEMCGKAKRNGRVPYCRVMTIRCVLELWATYPDFIILSEAPNNIREDMNKFLPMYDFVHHKEDEICLCWKNDTWKSPSKTCDSIEVSTRCRTVALQRIDQKHSVRNVTLIGVHMRRKKDARDQPALKFKEKQKILIRMRRLISDIPNHGVVIIGGDFNLNIHKYPCFPSTDKILIPSYLPTAASGCIDNIVVAKLECQHEMTVTVTRRDVINILDHPILDHNPVLGVFCIKSIACSNPAHA